MWVKPLKFLAVAVPLAIIGMGFLAMFIGEYDKAAACFALAFLVSPSKP